MMFKPGDTITTFDELDESKPFKGYVVSESDNLVWLFYKRKQSNIDKTRCWTSKLNKNLRTVKMVLIEKTIIWEY